MRQYLLLIFVIIVFICGVVTAGDNIPVSESPWTGSWMSEQFLFDIVQNGSEITGTFVTNLPGSIDTGWINGTVFEDGKNLSEYWSQKGPVMLTMEPDFETLSGTWGYYTNTTNGGSFTFVCENTDGWSGTWISKSHIFNLTKSGSDVAGSFEVR